MTDKHKRIWLQSGDTSKLLENGPMWCNYKLYDDDTEYVRADLYTVLEQRVERLENALGDVASELYDRPEMLAIAEEALAEEEV